MSDSKFAYHTVVHALEASSGWTPLTRFAASVNHVVNGLLPYERFNAAGQARLQSRTGAGEIERLVSDWLDTDLNPVVQVLRNQSAPDKALRGFNAYNASANLGVRTTASIVRSTKGLSSVIERRLRRTSQDDPEPCQIGAISVLRSIMDTTERNKRDGLTPRIFGLSDIAAQLGLTGSAGAEVANVLDEEGYITVGEVAHRIGCHQRTLERRLHEEGLTVETIRTATRLICATRRLRLQDSLTSIALEEGFSDHAHMTRSFRVSCGVTPSMLRQLCQ